MKFSFTKTRKITLFAPISFLILLWSLLYLHNLRSNPSWFMDETKALNCAINTAHFSPTYLATWNTFFHPITSYQPPYLFLTGIYAHGDILGARFFNSLLALTISLLLFIFGKRFLGIIGAFFTALLFLTYNQTLIHFRAVYPHNGVALGTTMTVLILCLYSTKKREWFAGIGLAIGAASHPMFIYPAIATFLTRWNKPKSWIRLFTPALIYLIIALILVYLRFGNWLWQDTQELWRWYHGDTIEQGGSFFTTLTKFYFKDWFHIGSLIAILYCLKKRFFLPVVFIAVISVCLFQNRNDFTDFYYQAVLLIPLLCLCWGKVIQKICVIARNFRSCGNDAATSLRAKGKFFILLFAFALFCIISAFSSIWIHHLDPYYRHKIIQKADSAQTAANWLNQHTTSNDTVISNSNIAWLLHAKKVHYLQAAAGDDTPALYYRDKVIPKERRLYDISLANAKYVVFCEVDLLWEPSRSDIKALANKMAKEHWKKVFASDDFAIFARE